MLLQDDQWKKLEQILIDGCGDTGTNSRNSRQFINAMVYIVETKSKWSQLPPEFGHWKKTHERFRRWSEYGQWKKLAESIHDDQDLLNMVQKIADFSKSYMESVEKKQGRRDELIKQQLRLTR